MTTRTRKTAAPAKAATPVAAPLDVSAWVPDNPDSEELRAYKEKVRKALLRFGVHQMLWKELALPTAAKVRVAVTTTHPFEVQVDVTAESLHGKTFEEQKVVLADAIGEVQVFGQAGKMGSVKFPAESIVSAKVVTAPPVTGELIWKRPQGLKTAHVFPDFTNDGKEAVASACGGTSEYPIYLRDPAPGTRKCSDCKAATASQTL